MFEFTTLLQKHYSFFKSINYKNIPYSFMEVLTYKEEICKLHLSWWMNILHHSKVWGQKSCSLNKHYTWYFHIHYFIQFLKYFCEVGFITPGILIYKQRKQGLKGYSKLKSWNLKLVFPSSEHLPLHWYHYISTRPNW